MQTLELTQGSPEWHEHRFNHFNASEAAAMLGLDKNTTRTQLLHMKSTGAEKEFSEWVQKNVLDYGHEVEELARQHIESVIDADLYPVTGTNDNLSASYDGLTVFEDIGFEHKQWNESLAESVQNKVVPDTHMPQLQQQLMVSGANKIIFVVSNGTKETMVSMDVLPCPEWFKRIKAGWEQFEKDLAEYVPVVHAEKPEADAIMQLPALSIQIKGEVTTSNLPQFKEAAETFIANIKTDLETDEDFANAEATVKFCSETEKKIELAKNAAIAQTASIDDLMRTMDHIKESMRVKRLALDKLVKSQKEAIKNKIVADASALYQEYTNSIHKEIKQIMPVRWEQENPKFFEAVKNKRTLESLHNAVDTELARCKIASDEIAKDIREKLSWFKENSKDNESLFPDISTIIANDIEHFKMVVNQRIEAHKAEVAAAAQKKLDAEKAETERLKQQAIDDAKAKEETLEPKPLTQKVLHHGTKPAEAIEAKTIAVQKQSADDRSMLPAATNAFSLWWHETGSGIIKQKNEDSEQHAKRVSFAAWMEVERFYLSECEK